MAGRISRRKLAHYVADGLQHDNTKVIQELAAFLIQTKRIRESELIVRDIEMELKQRGIVIADVASAYPLADAVKAEITAFISKHTAGSKTPTVHLREAVDPTLLGGVKVALPGELFDGTLRNKLNALDRAKLS